MKAVEVAVRPLRRLVTTTGSDHDRQIASDLLEQDVAATAPSQRWVTGHDLQPYGRGLAVLGGDRRSLFRKVDGWAMHRCLAVKAVIIMVADRQYEAGLNHHTDRGRRYASEDYRTALHPYGIIASMGRCGCCYDNTVAKSFQRTPESRSTGESFTLAPAARNAIFQYIDVFCSKARPHAPSAISVRWPSNASAQSRLTTPTQKRMRMSRLCF